MKDEERASTMRAGKGVRLPVTDGILGKIIDALQQARDVYETVDSPEEFMKLLELEGESETNYTRGRTTFQAHNKYIVIKTGSGEEFRMTFSLTNQGGFTLDFRGWFTPAGQG